MHGFMKAKIMMDVDGSKYEYGTYPYDTPEDIEKVVQICQMVEKERDVQTYIEKE